MLKHKLHADTGNGDPPPKKPPVEEPNKEPIEPIDEV